MSATGCVRCGSYLGLRKRGKDWLCRTHFYRVTLPAALMLDGMYVVLCGLVAGLADVAPAPFIAAGLVARYAYQGLDAVLRVVTARLTGLKVVLVAVGAGPLVAARRFGGTEVEWRLLPTYDWIAVTPRGDPRAYRWRLAWMATRASGPLLYVACFAVAPLLPDVPALAVVCAAGYALYWDIMMLAIGLQPHSDLYWLLRRPLRPIPVAFDTPAGWAVSTDEYFADVQAVADVSRRGGRVRPVAAEIERLHALQPDLPYFTYLYANLLIDERRWPESRAILADLRELEPDAMPGPVAMALAWLGAMAGDDPAGTDALLAVARAELPDLADGYAVAALVAARAGRLDEAVALCDAVTDASTLTAAFAEAVRAYVARRRGDAAAERAHAEAARALDPDCFELDLLN